MGDDRKLAVVGERVLGRDDEAWAPGKAGRARACGLDRDEARRDVADESGKRRRQGQARRKRRIGLTWEAPFPPKMSPRRGRRPPRQMVRRVRAASPMLCSAFGAAYISGLEERSEVRFDSLGLVFALALIWGARVRRDSAESRAAESGPSAALLRAGGEEGHARGRQRLRLAGRDGAAQSAVRRSDLPPVLRRRGRRFQSVEIARVGSRSSTRRVSSSPTTM